MLLVPLDQPLIWGTGFEVLTHFLKVMRGRAILLEVNAFFLVIYVSLRTEELLEHVQIT
jgi:hypothetical protein